MPRMCGRRVDLCAAPIAIPHPMLCAGRCWAYRHHGGLGEGKTYHASPAIIRAVADPTPDPPAFNVMRAIPFWCMILFRA